MDTVVQPRSPFSRYLAILLLVGFMVAGWYMFSRTEYQYEFSSGETVQNWKFQGAYTGKVELENRAQEEIGRLSSLIGVEGDDHTDYALYVSIANQYRLMGDGTSEFTYLKKALAIDDVTTGLAWHNLAVLLADRGAPRSAREAYKHAVDAQSQFIQYQTAYLEFLTENFKDEVGAIDEAFASAEMIFGPNASLLEIRAHWLESLGRIDEAIAAWKSVKLLSPAAAALIDSEIARLRSI